ncbi:Nucleotide-binding alpha-beta plait [Penicillium cf. griseofulvum]|uniref:Nucleotide-binding alpha-beta plait n=1 Tax=Penicillium cf. griseofulvum TaxID=2972120 RepID=A0A9W9JE85_9EURO|nr:Nucleotide-binding alpha-beta plait [Penicillium cf. griseofulvum]KAJ5445677.1 Nucleotide-binding alpha-beta plait [Penicillium cf. griseofulvum]
MREQSEKDEWAAHMSSLAYELAMMTLDNKADAKSQGITDTVPEKRSPHGNAHGSLKKSCSGTLDSQPDQVSAPSITSLSIPTAPSLPSAPSSLISSHHYSSSSTSTIRPKPKPLNLAPEVCPSPFNYVTQVYSPPTYQPHHSQYYFEVAPQVYHNAADFAPQSQPKDVFKYKSSQPRAKNMGWPFEQCEVSNYGDFGRLESSKIEELLQPTSIPFGSVTDMHTSTRDGVLMISNIPYTVTRQEVASFLGRSANLLPSSQGCPIHIVMERSTGKTMDCFVEFPTQKDAEDTFERINRAYDAGSTPRMGNRHVDIEVSTPAKLLKATFPRAKCISWEGGKPVQLSNEDSWSTGFDGFLTDEELFCLTRHAEQPHRSAFASKVPQRCYESFVGTIWKFPWHATHLYTVHHRNALFKTLGTLIKTLVERMQKTNTVGLDIRLLNELVHAGIWCPGFNPRMKYCFAWWSQDVKGIETLDHDWCLYFPFDSLTYVPGHGGAAIQFYAYLMSKGAVLRTENEGLINKHTHPAIERIFGRFWFEWHDDAARVTTFKDAVNYEATVLRKFIITGFQHLHKRNSSVSTIGTAPGSSPTHSHTSADSERTVSASRTGSANPAESSALSASSVMTSSIPEHGSNWSVPGNTRGSSQRLDADQYLSGTSSRQAPPSVRPYRPPHQRDVSETTRKQSANWRMPRTEEAPAAGSSKSQDRTRPVYRAPHATAQNVRSSSDPFAPVPSTAATSHRSRSDAARLSNIDRQAFDELCAAGHGKTAKK